MKLNLPEPDTLAIISFTSGTTGLPKGTKLSHKMVCANLSEFDIWMDLTMKQPLSEKDSILCYVPLVHSSSYMMLNMSAYFGGKIGLSKCDPAQLMSEI